MDRRKFLTGLAAVVGGIALNEAVPLGRVWSFPKEIKLAPKFPLSLQFHPYAFALIEDRVVMEYSSRTLQRFDVLYGFAEIPQENFFDAEGNRLSGVIGRAAGFDFME